MQGKLTKCSADLTATLIRGGKAIDSRRSHKQFSLLVSQTWWQRLKALIFVELGLVTNAGAYYLATDFAAGQASPHISAMNYHDCGTGTTAAAVGDTTLQTPAGTARVAGTRSNPSNGVYRSVATIGFSSNLAITEWGLFSAASSGTMWDHRVFAPINVSSGDSIQFTYSLTIPSGGS
jgi:hypothetical protein